MVRKLELKQIAITVSILFCDPQQAILIWSCLKNDEQNLAKKAEITVLPGIRYHRDGHREWMRDDF